jgi:hypothetical protein
MIPYMDARRRDMVIAINGVDMRIDLNEMSRRLGRAIPEPYRAFIESNEIGRYERTLADPAEICALNLGESTVDPSGPATRGFVLYGEDGNFYLIRDGDESGALRYWSHETRELVATASDAHELIQQLAATPIPDLDAESLALSRVEPWTQSILNPIRPHELHAAVEGIPNVTAFEYTEHINPFTGEPFKLHTPGLWVNREPMEPLILKLTDGRLHCIDAPRPLPDQVQLLAKRLSARVFPDDS